MHKKDYQIIDKTDSKKLTEFLCKQGQLLLPLVEMITHTETALDELIDLTGRAAIEAVLTLSAQEIAGAKHPGKKAGDIRWYGRQSTTVPLSNLFFLARRAYPKIHRWHGHPAHDHGRDARATVYDALCDGQGQHAGKRRRELLLAARGPARDGRDRRSQ